MKENNLLLSKVLNLDKWQSLQDSLASMTGLAIVIVDYKGAPITKHSNCSSFCNIIRSDPKLCQYCEKCDSRGGLEAVRLNKPYVYRCHFDIVDIAIPIIINNNYVGAIMAGQVKVKDSAPDLEDILPKSNRSLEQEFTPEMIEYYKSLKTLPYDNILESSNMLYKLLNYIVEEALNKNILIEMYERLFRSDKDKGISSPVAQEFYPMQTIETMRDELSTAITKSYLDGDNIHVNNPLLRPAFEYLQRHKTDNITMNKLASVCNLSPSYFSRLFSKETGDTYSNYLAKLKVNLAISLLDNSDMPIAQISDALGFSDPSYFNRTFKRIKNMTPALYRKYYANK